MMPKLVTSKFDQEVAIVRYLLSNHLACVTYADDCPHFGFEAEQCGCESYAILWMQDLDGDLQSLEGIWDSEVVMYADRTKI